MLNKAVGNKQIPKINSARGKSLTLPVRILKLGQHLKRSFLAVKTIQQPERFEKTETNPAGGKQKDKAAQTSSIQLGCR